MLLEKRYYEDNGDLANGSCKISPFDQLQTPRESNTCFDPSESLETSPSPRQTTPQHGTRPDPEKQVASQKTAKAKKKNSFKASKNPRTKKQRWSRTRKPRRSSKPAKLPMPSIEEILNADIEELSWTDQHDEILLQLIAVYGTDADVLRLHFPRVPVKALRKRIGVLD